MRYRHRRTKPWGRNKKEDAFIRLIEMIYQASLTVEVIRDVRQKGTRFPQKRTGERDLDAEVSLWFRS